MEQFENKVLFIKDEEMLYDVEKLLDCQINHFVNENPGKQFNYLVYAFNQMVLIDKVSSEKLEKINFEQFKELLKQK